MKLISAKCPCCGGNINVDENIKVTKCEYCNTNILIKDNCLKAQELKIRDDNTFSHKKNERKKYKIILSVFTLLLFLFNIIAMKISWDYKNSLGFIAFLFSGLLNLYGIKNSKFRYRSLFIVNVICLPLFVGAFCFSLYIYNLLPGYVNKWANNNILLIIDREEATIEFKDTGLKKSSKYSTSNELKYSDGKIIQYTRIKIESFSFIYFEDKDIVCYSNEKDECVEVLKHLNK